MCDNFQALKQSVELHAAEAAQLGKQLQELKEQTQRDRDGLKHAIRVHRQRAEQMEASTMTLQTQLMEKVTCDDVLYLKQDRIDLFSPSYII